MINGQLTAIYVMWFFLGCILVGSDAQAQDNTEAQPAGNSVLQNVGQPPKTNAKGPGRISILVQDLEGDASVSKDVLRTLNGFVVVSLNRTEGLEVISGEDIRRIADLQAGRLEMGCEMDEACLVELAHALGARYVVYGRVATLDNVKIMEMDLLDSENVRVIQRTHLHENSFSSLGEAVDQGLKYLLKPLWRQLEKSGDPSPQSEPISQGLIVMDPSKEKTQETPWNAEAPPASSAKTAPSSVGAAQEQEQETPGAKRVNPDKSALSQADQKEGTGPNWLLWGGGLGAGLGAVAAITSAVVGVFSYWQFQQQLSDGAVADDARSLSARVAFGAALASGAGAVLGLGGAAVAVAGVALE